MRTFVSAAVALVLCAGGLNAGDYKGKVTKVEGKKITISVDGKDMTFTVTDTTKFTTKNKKLAEKLETEKLACKIFTRTGKRAPTVTISSEDGKTAQTISVGGRGGKKKKKTDN